MTPGIFSQRVLLWLGPVPITHTMVSSAAISVVLVVTFALCGFSNLSSIAILLGGLGAVIPTRRHDIARLGLKAVIAGMLVNLMNAALAGFFYSLAPV